MDLSIVTPGSRPYLDIAFPEPPVDRPYIYFNMVGSLDGHAVIRETEQGLGSREDKRRMQELRAHADAILNGAETLRRSGASSRVRDDDLMAWRQEHGYVGQPLGLILTRHADFEFRGPYFQHDSGLDALILGTDIAPARVAEIEATGAAVRAIAPGPDGLREAMRYLRQERGVRYLLCEGGPTVLGSLVHAGLADEFFLTSSPLLVGGTETRSIFETGVPFGREDIPRLEVQSVLANAETHELYLRYRFAGKGALV